MSFSEKLRAMYETPDMSRNGCRAVLTPLLGTQIGVPSFTIPASTITPITIGSRELNTN